MIWRLSVVMLLTFLVLSPLPAQQMPNQCGTLPIDYEASHTLNESFAWYLSKSGSHSDDTSIKLSKNVGFGNSSSDEYTYSEGAKLTKDEADHYIQKAVQNDKQGILNYCFYYFCAYPKRDADSNAAIISATRSLCENALNDNPGSKQEHDVIFRPTWLPIVFDEAAATKNLWIEAETKRGFTVTLTSAVEQDSLVTVQMPNPITVDSAKGATRIDLRAQKPPREMPVQDETVTFRYGDRQTVLPVRLYRTKLYLQHEPGLLCGVFKPNAHAAATNSEHKASYDYGETNQELEPSPGVEVKSDPSPKVELGLDSQSHSPFASVSSTATCSRSPVDPAWNSLKTTVTLRNDLTTYCGTDYGGSAASMPEWHSYLFLPGGTADQWTVKISYKVERINADICKLDLGAGAPPQVLEHDGKQHDDEISLKPGKYPLSLYCIPPNKDSDFGCHGTPNNPNPPRMDAEESVQITVEGRR